MDKRTLRNTVGRPEGMSFKEWKKSPAGRAHYNQKTKRYWATEKGKEVRRRAEKKYRAKMQRVYKVNYSRSWHMKKRYGITLAEHDALVEKQLGLCAICLVALDLRGYRRNRPQIDHDHVTGKVRAILCAKCNTAIGLLNEDVTLFNRAIEYLALHRAP